MKRVGENGQDYGKILAERGLTSHVYRKYQLIGLEVAGILEDNVHKALYIKLAKDFGSDRLLALAKTVAENRNVRNKGAYFMSALMKLRKTYENTKKPEIRSR